MKKQYAKIFFAITALTLTGCDSGPDEPNPSKPLPTDIRIVVANEGQYGQGTASLTALTYDGKVSHDLFRSANERTIGDVAQSILEFNGNYYVTLNNSRKVEVFNVKTYKSVETIVTGEKTIPAYMCHLGGDSIALTEKSNNGLLTIIDTNHDKKDHKAIRRTVKIGSAEQMLVFGKKLFIASSGGVKVLDLGNITEKGMRQITGEGGANVSVNGDTKIILDKNNKLWVLSGSSTNAKLVCIDPITESVIKSDAIVGLDLGWYGARIEKNPAGDSLFVNGEFDKKKVVFGFDIKNPSTSTTPLFAISDDVKVVYNMAVSKENTIFICDVEYGSIARGKVHELDKKGKVINTFEAGIFPQYIHFK